MHGWHIAEVKLTSGGENIEVFWLQNFNISKQKFPSELAKLIQKNRAIPIESSFGGGENFCPLNNLSTFRPQIYKV